jgi:hypothetical protein
MISRSTLIAALVVVELAIVGVAGSALTGGRVGIPALPGPAAFAAQPAVSPVDRTFLTGLTPRVAIDVRDVHVTVETAPGPSVRVRETLAVHGFVTGHTVPLTAEQTPDGVRVQEIGEEGGHVMLGSFERTLTVTVPPGALVDLTTAGDIDVSGLRAKLVAHTSDGAIHLRDHQGDVDVTTDSGRIEMVDVHGTAIDAVDHDGRIYLTRVGADRLQAHSDSGRIVGEGVRAVDGSLTTLDGRILVSFTATSDATATVHTDDGDVNVAGFTTIDDSHDSRVVRLGEGRGHFEVTTADGPITITQGANS